MSKALKNTIDKILNDYMITLGDVKSRRRFTPILEPRWLCWYIYRITSEYSLEDIGWKFDRHHTSIINGLKHLKEKHSDKIKIYEEYYRAEKEKEKELDQTNN